MSEQERRLLEEAREAFLSEPSWRDFEREWLDGRVLAMCGVSAREGALYRAVRVLVNELRFRQEEPR